MENLKLEVGARIRIKEGCGVYPHYADGSEGTVVAVVSDFGATIAFDKKYQDGTWNALFERFDVIEQANTSKLSHSEYYKTYGTLTEERILDLLAVYERAAGVACCSEEELAQMEQGDIALVDDLIRRVREVDASAADYLEANKYNPAHLPASDRLHGLFIWAASPQGTEYWGRLAQQLGEN